eukprot:14287727-Ditylum_brightwellii.AAC.1
MEKGYLPYLYGGGKARKVHATTIKWLQVTTASQRLWHNTVSSILDEQMRRNRNLKNFCEVIHQCVSNVDGACIIASDGYLYVVGDAQRSKSDKNVADGRFSANMVRSGTTAN